MSASLSGRGRGTPQRRFGSAPSTNPYSRKLSPEYEYDEGSDTWKEVTPALSFPSSDTGSLPPVAGQSCFRSPTASPPISRKKAKWRADSPASEASSSAEDLSKVSTISPLIASIISGLGEQFNPDNIDVVANPDLVDLEAVKSIFRYIVCWSSQPEMIQFLASLPQGRSLLGTQYEYMQRRFSEIGLYTLLSPPATGSPSPMDHHSLPPPTAPAKAPVTSAAGAAAGGSIEESSGPTRAPGAGMSRSAHRRHRATEPRTDPLPQLPFDAPEIGRAHV